MSHPIIDVYISSRIWLFVLAKHYPQLQFIGRLPDIRSHVDTNRNYGVHHVLLQLQGPPNPEAIRESLLNSVLATKSNGNAELVHPKIRQCLAKHHGFYAWNQDKESFDISNHVVVAETPVVRGRMVCAANVQEYVSRAVSKYLSLDQPPWHIELIPTVAEVKPFTSFLFKT